MSTKLTIEFTPPRHGWMEVALGIELRFVASHVPYDSLDELVSALLALLESGRSGVARFNGEPEEYVLSVERGGSPDSLRLRLNDWSHEGEAREIARTIWRALRKLESRFAAEHWNHEFPARRLEQLHATLLEVPS